ncbi:hypothetical protein JQX14_04105 [Sulfitobacter pseudonitzschiae]|uniref:Uncharacterized protein n=1 Tax=Pseudosulfitobacter pseudonitzschiae TaxID=1402135 RepID=A0A9Q2NYB3_9RHOB|nr:hypothetical protein [Pseudosulfitobacter pseudonitzschiae]
MDGGNNPNENSRNHKGLLQFGVGWHFSGTVTQIRQVTLTHCVKTYDKDHHLVWGKPFRQTAGRDFA